MPSYAIFVALMTDPSAGTRSNSLSSLLATVKVVSSERRLLMLKEEGMLPALEKFLTPENVRATGQVALDVFYELLKDRGTIGLADAEKESIRIVYSSPLMSRIIAATSVHREAYAVINGLSCSDALAKDLFEYNGIVEALTRGLQTDDEYVHDGCIATIANITQVHIFDHTLFPELVNGIVNKFCTHGMSDSFKCTHFSRALLFVDRFTNTLLFPSMQADVMR
jgi:hypothetical protein